MPAADEIAANWRGAKMGAVAQTFLKGFSSFRHHAAVTAKNKAAYGCKRAIAIGNELREGLLFHRDFTNLVATGLRAADFAGLPFNKTQRAGIGLIGRFVTAVDLVAPVSDLVWFADRKDWKNRSAIDWAEGTAFLAADVTCVGLVLGSWGVPLLSRASSAIGTLSLGSLALSASLPLGVAAFLTTAYTLRAASGIRQIIKAKNSQQKIYGGLKIGDGAVNAALWSTIAVTALLAGTKLAVVGPVVAGLTAASPYILPFAFFGAAIATCSVHLYRVTHKTALEGKPQPKGHRIGDRDDSNTVKAKLKNGLDNSVMMLKEFFGLTSGIDPLSKFAQGSTKLAAGFIKIARVVGNSPQLLKGSLSVIDEAGSHFGAVVEWITLFNVTARIHEVISGQYSKMSKTKQWSRGTLFLGHALGSIISFKNLTGMAPGFLFREVVLGPLHLSPLRLVKDAAITASAGFSIKESMNVLGKAKAELYGNKQGKLGAIRKKEKWQQRTAFGDQAAIDYLRGKYSEQRVSADQFSEKTTSIESQSNRVKHEAFSKETAAEIIAVFEKAKADMVASVGGKEADLSAAQKRVYKSFDWNSKQLEELSKEGKGLASLYQTKASRKAELWEGNEKALKARRSLLQKFHFGASMPYDSGKILLCSVGIVTVLFAVTLNIYLATIVAALGVATATFGCIKFGMNVWKEYQFGTNDPNNRFFLPKTFLPDAPAPAPAAAAV